MPKKVAIFIGDGSEPIEVVAPADALRRGGVDVHIVSVMSSPEVKMAHGITIAADALIDQVDMDAYDMLIVPGGNGGVENLGRNQKLADALISFINQGKQVSSICAGPTILAKLHLLDGFKATCYPGCQTDFPEGSYVAGPTVVTDNNLITASGPGVALDFGIAMLRALEGDQVADSVASGMLVS